MGDHHRIDNGPNEWTKYYRDKNLADLFQGFTAALLYHQPEDPVEFLMDVTTSLLNSTRPAEPVGWWTFLPSSSSTKSAGKALKPVVSPTHGDMVSGTPTAGSKRREVEMISDILNSDMAQGAVVSIENVCESDKGEEDVQKHIKEDNIRHPVTRTNNKQVTENHERGDPEDAGDPDDDEDHNLYTALPQTRGVSHKFWDVLRGSMADLPPMPKNTVRIFLSSTFSDFKAERNILPQHAFPRLEEFCAVRGYDFQVVDMRWGVTDEVVHDHQVSALCISEIKTCQQLSCGPNFVVLLGDRYGWQGFPPRIQADEFSTLALEVKETSDKELLETWFKKDENAVPPEYILQPIDSCFKHYNDTENSESKTADKKGWDQVSSKLQHILRTSVKAAKNKGKITDQQEEKYFISVTEEEIVQGVFRSDDPAKRTMCYHRTLQGISRATPTVALGKFIDLEPGQGVPDKYAETRRRQLLQDKLRPYLPSHNIKDYEVGWKDEPLHKSTDPELKTYLQRFAEDFVEDIQANVLSNMNTANTEDSKWTPLYHEVLHHAWFGYKKCDVFCGREEEVVKVAKYLRTGENGGHGPLVLYGPSGIGKTALMAHIGRHIKQSLYPKCTLVLRFLGTSPLSTNISDTLQSIISQLSLVFRTKVPTDGSLDMFGKVRKLFQNYLQKLSKRSKEPIILMLDSIDQLSQASGAHRMLWLPRSLPKNVYCIVSMLTQDGGNTLSNTQRRLVDEQLYVEISPLSRSVGHRIITEYLSRSNRKLAEGQLRQVREACERFGHPLYLKLVIDAVKTWPSYLPNSPPAILTPCAEVLDVVQSAISHLFELLEAKYGGVLVTHALSYLTCGNRGLTEIEMEDVLSCDDHVLNDVYHYHEPPLEGVVRIPSLLWSRLQDALKEYICERLVDGKVVLYWYHRQFWQTAEVKYLSDPGERQGFHHALADIYLHENGIRRTITLHKCNAKVVQDADRRIKHQPLDVKNHRKLQALPYHLYHSSNYSLLVSRCLINFKWLHTKLCALGINALIQDYSVLEDHHNVQIMKKFLEICFDSLIDDPNTLAYNLVERLEQCSIGDAQLEQVVRDAREWMDQTQRALLVPTFSVELQTPDSAELFSTMLGYTGQLTPDQRVAVCLWYEMNSNVCKIQALELSTRDIVSSVTIMKPAPFAMLPDSAHYVLAEGDVLRVYEVDTGDVVRTVTITDVTYDKVTVRSLAVSRTGQLAAVVLRTKRPLNVQHNQWRGATVMMVVDITNETVRSSTSPRGKHSIDAVFFADNDHILIATTRTKITIYNAQDLAIIKEFENCGVLFSSTCQVRADLECLVALRTLTMHVQIVLVNYKTLEMQCSENVHAESDEDQKKATPVGQYTEDGSPNIVLASWGDRGDGKEPLSSICVRSLPLSADLSIITLRPQGYKPPVSITAVQQWRYALVGWTNGHISVVRLDTQQQLTDISSHAHIIHNLIPLRDSKTLITMSQDHSLKVWDLPMIIRSAEDGTAEAERVNDDLQTMRLHKHEQCLDLVASSKFIVTAPPNNLSAPRYWSYESGRIVADIALSHQRVYDKSLKENDLHFLNKAHGAVAELPGEVIVYERTLRDKTTVCVLQGFNSEHAKVLAHRHFEHTFFRLIVPQSGAHKTPLLYLVHDGKLGVYDALTLKALKEIDIPRITDDVVHIDSSGGKRRLQYYRVAVSADDKYFIILNPAGGPDGKYMDIIELDKGNYKARYSLNRYTSINHLVDGCYFLCTDDGEERERCLSIFHCAQEVEERGGRDFRYRTLLLTGSFVSTDRQYGCSLNNKTHTIYAWHVPTLTLISTLTGHNHEVVSVHISADNHLLVSGSYDGTVRVWNLHDGVQLSMFNVGAVQKVVFSPCTTHVAVLCYHMPQRKRALSLKLLNSPTPKITVKH